MAGKRKRKQKIVTRTSPVEVAKLSRHDYATTARQAATTTAGTLLIPDKRFDMDLVLTKPIQVRVAMSASYAAELLRELSSAKKPRRGECHQISVDCPVEILVDSATLVEMIDQFKNEI